MSLLANYCEVDPRIPREKHVTRTPLDQPKKINISEFYTLYKKAKSKSEKGALLRLMVPWNDIPPEIWKDLEENFPLQKATSLKSG